MAFDRPSIQPGFWLPGDINRPQGNAKSSTTPTSKDGSPWSKLLIDDYEGFFQGLLFQAGVAPSGNPDTVLISDYFDSLELLFKRRGRTSQVFTIPTDYSDLSEAITDIANRFTADQGVDVEINIEAGHVLTKGFRVQNGNYGFIKITSVDAVVSLDPAFVFVSNTDLDGAIPRTAAIGFLAVNATMPEWDILVDASARADFITGYELDHESFGFIRPAKGITNVSGGALVGTNARITSGSQLEAYQANFDDGGGEGVQFTVNSKGVVAEASCQNCGNSGLDVSRGSVVYANSINCSGAGTEGAYVRRSWLSAQIGVFNNCGVGVYAAIGSRIVATDADFTGSTIAAKSDDGGIIDVSKATGIAGTPIVPSDISLSGFNRLEGDGLITNSLWVNGSVDYVDAKTVIAQVAGDLVPVGSLVFATILNLAGQHKLHSGMIYGQDVGVRITLDGVVVLDDQGRFRGDDSAANQHAMVPIPSLVSQTSMLIEMFNRAGAISNLGYRIYHT